MKDFNIDNSKKLDLVNLQRICVEWRKYNFPKSTADQQFKGVVEELGELSHADLKAEQGIRQDGIDPITKEMDAAGDLVIYLLNFCDMKGFTLEAAIKLAWQEACIRDWIKYPKNGLTE
jgi:NTP pyrophosphatase (non-canonical NTP hydrolase)